MRKKLISIVLAGVLTASAFAGSMISASAKVNADFTYTPGDDVITNRVYLAMPGAWISDVTKAQDNVGGCYWWGGTDTPGSQPEITHDWPGYKTYTDTSEAGIENLRYIDVPIDAPMIILNNYIDGGMDPTQPQFDAACQIVDTQAESYAEGDSDYYPQYFWDYINENYDDFDFSDFGKYEDNFGDDTVYGNGIVHTLDNMVYVVDLREENMVISTTIVPEGKPTYRGAFYFYYGNGEFGIWPTKELAIEQEGLTFDEEGNLVTDGLTLDKSGFVMRKAKDCMGEEKDFVVYGNFTGNYWQDTSKPTPVVVPQPDNQDATSATKAAATGDSTNNTNNNANGSVATGDFSMYAIAFVVITGALGVFYFTRKKFNK